MLVEPSQMIPLEEKSNYEVFRECLSDVLIRKLTTKPSKPARRRATKGRKNAIKPVNAAASEEEQSASDAEDLGDFIDVGNPPDYNAVAAAAPKAPLSTSPPRSLPRCPRTSVSYPTPPYKTTPRCATVTQIP